MEGFYWSNSDLDQFLERDVAANPNGGNEVPWNLINMTIRDSRSPWSRVRPFPAFRLLWVSKNNTVDYLKQQVRERLCQISPWIAESLDQFNLCFGGRLLKDGQVLGTCVTEDEELDCKIFVIWPQTIRGPEVLNVVVEGKMYKFPVWPQMGDSGINLRRAISSALRTTREYDLWFHDQLVVGSLAMHGITHNDTIHARARND